MNPTDATKAVINTGRSRVTVSYTHLIEQIFATKIPDPLDKQKKITRSELAFRHNIRVIKEAIDAKSVAEFTLLEIKSLIRYSLVDHLSDSSVAAI